MGLDCRERIDVAMQRLGSLAKDGGGSRQNRLRSPRKRRPEGRKEGLKEVGP